MTRRPSGHEFSSRARRLDEARAVSAAGAAGWRDARSAPATPGAAPSPKAEPGWVLARRRSASRRLKWWAIGAVVGVSATVASLINPGDEARAPLVSEARAFASAIAESAGLPAPRFVTDTAILLGHGMPHAEWGGVAWFVIRPVSSDTLAVANEVRTNPSCPAHSVRDRATPGARYAHYAVDCAMIVRLVPGEAESASVVSRSAGGSLVIYFQHMASQQLERIRRAVDVVTEGGAF